MRSNIYTLITFDTLFILLTSIGEEKKKLVLLTDPFFLILKAHAIVMHSYSLVDYAQKADRSRG